jgi:hypothetical protein
MKVLRNVTLDNLISLYEGHAVDDRKKLEAWETSLGTPAYEMMKRELAQDQMILSGLKCAKANGFTGE